MAKRTTLIVDDISGKATPEDELTEIEYRHPVSGKVYILLTTPENFETFSAKVAKEADKMATIRREAEDVYEETARKAREVCAAAMQAAAEDLAKLTADLGAPLETLIAKAAKGYADWEEKPVRTPAGRRPYGTGDPVRARELAVNKARNQFINSDLALEVGGKQMRAFIMARRAKPKGRLSDTLLDWLNQKDIEAIWHPDAQKDSQPALV